MQQQNAQGFEYKAGNGILYAFLEERINQRDACLMQGGYHQRSFSYEKHN
jgi:hypothetical protein